MFLMANAGVLAATADAAPDAWRRLVGYLLQGCAAPGTQPLPDPPAPRQMYRAMLRATHHQRGWFLPGQGAAMSRAWARSSTRGGLA